MTFGTGFLSGLICGVLGVGLLIAVAFVVELLIDKIREMFGNE